MQLKSKLTFVYLGNYWPKYASASIELAKTFSGLDVRLITNLSQEIKVNNLEIIEVDKFYDPAKFNYLTKSRILISKFRDNFWIKTLERFFVLEQYMKISGEKSIFHAELDQILFRNDQLISNIEKTKNKGLFFPYHISGQPIASIFYCNEYAALESLIKFANSESNYSSDMQLLGQWSKAFPDLAFILPSLATTLRESEFRNETKAKILSPESLEGLVDGAQLGQWIAGIDPRNVPILSKPRNHHVDEPHQLLLTNEDLRKIKYDFDSETNFLKINFGQNKYGNLYNFHIHSKVHRWLRLPSKQKSVNRIIDLANSDTYVTIPGTRRAQISNYFLEKIYLLSQRPLYALEQLLSILVSKINNQIGFRPSSQPFIAGDSFRKIADFVYEKPNPQLDVSKLVENNLIFCESDLYDKLFDLLIKNNSPKVNLILGNSDQNFESNSLSEFQISKLNFGLVQNLISPIKGLAVLPIGLENAWHFKNGKKFLFRLNRFFRAEKVYRIAWTFRLTNKLERLEAGKALVECKTADYLGDISVFKHQRALAKYGFVASPPGNGLDTHRTWEAMYLNCVPIVKRSYMTEEYEKLGLPVWIVDSYDELKNLDEDLLYKKYEEIKPKFNSEVLWFKYWEDRLKVTS